MSEATIGFLAIQILNGLAYSLLLFLLAAGLSLIFGMMDVINLAHGSFYMVGAYVGLSILKLTGNYWVALAAAPVAVGIVALVLERTFLRPVYGRGHLDQVLLTFGFAYIFMDLARWIWGADVQSLPPPPFLSGSVNVLGGFFPKYRLFVIFLGLAAALVLWVAMEKTRLGAIVRAGVSDKEMAAALGINISLVFSLVFAFGAALAAMSGVVAGPILSLFPGMDFETLILTLIVVVVGGLGTLQGSFWGSLLIGQADTFGKILLPRFALFLIYAIMAAVLVIRPSGLFRREGAS